MPMAQSLHSVYMYTLCESHRFVCAQQFSFVSIDDALARLSQWSWVRHSLAKPSQAAHHSLTKKPKSRNQINGVTPLLQCVQHFRSIQVQKHEKKQRNTNNNLLSRRGILSNNRSLAYLLARCWNIFQLCRFVLFLWVRFLLLSRLCVMYALCLVEVPRNFSLFI